MAIMMGGESACSDWYVAPACENVMDPPRLSRIALTDRTEAKALCACMCYLLVQRVNTQWLAQAGAGAGG